MNTIIVIDLEATCWFPRNANMGQEQEVIAIGSAKLTIDGRDYKVEPLECIYVQPEQSTISDFCTALTGITQAHLDKHGVTLKEALERTRKHCQGPEYMYSWASFGLDDRIFLQKQCKRFDVRYPLSETHFDIQGLLMLMRGDRKTGLQKALKSFGLTFEGQPHNAMDDALNASRVLGEMVKRYRMKEIK